MVQTIIDGMAVANWTAVSQLQQELDDLKADYRANSNAFFMCFTGLIIFFMQCGFAFLEAGAVRSKNTTNILIKNLLDSCIVIVAYWATGYAFAFGGDAGDYPLSSIIGNSGFFLNGVTDYPKFFFAFTFAATASTIVSGAVVERCEFVCYLVYCSVISALVFPLLTHWGWSPTGWMALGVSVGDASVTYIDFAGSGLVHLCGGTISFFAAYMIGPRIGRFPDEKSGEAPAIEIQGHSVPFTSLGGFILMTGFLAFNGGSTADITSHGVGNTVALAMTNTIMSGAFSALVYLLIHYVASRKWTLLLTINACLTGMVSICAGCDKLPVWGAALTGVGASLTYLFLSKMMVKLKIDDPLDAFAVHAGGGLWGLIAVCLFSPSGVFYALGHLISGHDSKFMLALIQLGWNMVSALAIVGLCTVIMVPVFWALKKIGKLRVPPEIEIRGLDIFYHNECSYPIWSYGHGWLDETDNNNVEDGKVYKKSFSKHAEISIEELAEAYERKTSVLPKVDHRKLSFYHNRHRYEHPESHKMDMKTGHAKTNGSENHVHGNGVQKTTIAIDDTPELSRR